MAIKPDINYLKYGVGAGVLGDILGFKTDKEIRQEKIREYLKRLAEMRGKSLERLSAETGKNVGRINQYTTGTLQRTQGDLGARSASRGRGADEADFLAAQGQITGQGSEAIQKTQDAAERERRRLEDYYDNLALQAEEEGIFAPEDPNIFDVADSLLPAAVQYGFNQQLLNNTGTQSGVPSGNISSNVIPRRPTVNVSEIPADFTIEDESPRSLLPMRSDTVRSLTKPDYNFMDDATNFDIPRRRDIRRFPSYAY